MTKFVSEQTITEKLKQKQIIKKLGIDEDQISSSNSDRPYTDKEKEELCKKIFGK